jgi:hypothetical protein
MLTRREVALGGLLTVGLIPMCASGAQSRTLGGCVISDQRFAIMVGSRPVAFAFDIDNDPVQNGSGNKDFDRALAVTLSKLTDVFGVLPGFAFYDEGTESPNACACESRRLGRDDGSVAFSLGLLRELMQSPDNPELAVASVCAHEFGHILQNKLGLRDRLIGRDRLITKLELHADYLAGYFAGIRKKERSDFPAAVFALTQYKHGDFSNHPEHHGTPDERAQAVVAGFEAAFRRRESLSVAIEEGIRQAGAY